MSGAPAIIALRDAVLGELRRKLTGLKSVERHGGTFDEDELKRVAADAPCLRLAIVGVERTKAHHSGQFVAPVNFGLVILAKDSAREGAGLVSRDHAAMAICTAAMLAIDGHRFGVEGVFPPEDLRGQNEFSGALDKQGVAIWQVTWTQPILLGETRDDAIKALAQLWVNGEEFGPGVEPPNEHPLGPLPVGPNAGLPGGAP